MTTSPYDNLPSGNNDITPPKYVDVEITPPPAPIVEAAIPVKTAPAAKTIPLTPPPQYTNISLKNLDGCCEYILHFEESLLVPDTMPDMQKVLFAEGSVCLAQPLKTGYDKNDFLAGDITAYTIYRPVPSVPSPSAGPAAYDDRPVAVVKSIIPFKTDKCWANASGDNFKPVVSIRNISAEMINERKFIVKGELLIKMSCITNSEMKVFKSCADNDIVTLKRPVLATVLDNETSQTTEISQDITVRDDQPSPVQILKTSINVVENHRQLTSGKLVVNASIHLEALYLGEDDDGQNKLCCLNNKTDFTQFIVMPDDTGPDLICIDFGYGDLQLTIDNKEKFILQGNVTSLIRAYRNNHIDVVTDAYHKKKDLRFDLIHSKLNCVKTTVAGEISAREVINLTDSDKKPAVMLCGSCRIASLDGSLEKGRIVIEGSMPVKLLALDENNVPFIVENTMPIRGGLETSGPLPENPQICIDAAIKEFWFGEINSRQLEINTVLTLTVWISAEETVCTIDDLCFTDNDAPTAKACMALYVVGDGDTLWDVAKRYKIDVGSIAALNDLDLARPLPAGTKLFISK